MKHLIVLLLTAVSLSASTLTDSIDAAYTSSWATLVQSLQTSELSANGIHTQLPWTHKVAPADGVAVTPDNLAEVVDGGGRKYADLVDIAATPMRARLKIDVYNGASGKGYVVTIQLIENGQLWSRSINTGPESGRSKDWHEVIVSEIP